MNFVPRFCFAVLAGLAGCQSASQLPPANQTLSRIAQPPTVAAAQPQAAAATPLVRPQSPRPVTTPAATQQPVVAGGQWRARRKPGDASLILTAHREDEPEQPAEPEAKDPKPAAEKPEAGEKKSEPAAQKPKPGEPEAEDQEPDAPSHPGLPLEEVVVSIIHSYPLLLAVQQERFIAAGNLLSAEGKFDTKLKAGAIEAPVGFYRNYQHFIGVEQPLFSGANVFSGYRIGRGEFEPWYKERETNEGGEFKAGVQLPLLQNRFIDERRLGIQQGLIAQQAAEPMIRADLLEFIREGSFAYWQWVAAGVNYRIASELLEIANDRTEALQKRLDEGDISEIELTDNERLIASRQVKLSQADQKLRESAVKLALYLRHPDGTPRIPTLDEIPSDFPGTFEPNLDDPQLLVETAWNNRPELLDLKLKSDALQVDLSQAVNLARPNLDFEVVGSQDVGKRASKSGDKSEFEMDASLQLSVPLQRRMALGKQHALEAKLAQLNAKTLFTRDKIAAEVGGALIALQATGEQIERNRESLELARKLEQAERIKFDEGESNLLLVNIREQTTADAAAALAESQFAHQLAIANYQAILALLPAQLIAPPAVTDPHAPPLP